MQLAQLYYVEREFCCGVLTAFLGFFVAEGLFDSFPLEDFAETCLRLRSFETTSLFLAPSFCHPHFLGDENYNADSIHYIVQVCYMLGTGFCGYPSESQYLSEIL